LSDGLEKESEGTITAYGKNNIIVQTGKITTANITPHRRVTLYCSLLKKENFEFVVQKATEIGVEKIVPVISERTIKTNLNIPRLSLIALEAAEQSGHSFVPQINEPVAFKKALASATGDAVFFAPGGMDAGSALEKTGDFLGVFIGPEGGWSEAELALAKERYLPVCNLGSSILRGETAAIIASYLAVNI
jgi:16S rRNA (uracil1498-N3)-methyltransferase